MDFKGFFGLKSPYFLTSVFCELLAVDSFGLLENLPCHVWSTQLGFLSGEEELVSGYVAWPWLFQESMGTGSCGHKDGGRRCGAPAGCRWEMLLSQLRGSALLPAPSEGLEGQGPVCWVTTKTVQLFGVPEGLCILGNGVHGVGAPRICVRPNVRGMQATTRHFHTGPWGGTWHTHNPVISIDSDVHGGCGRRAGGI